MERGTCPTLPYIIRTSYLSAMSKRLEVANLVLFVDQEDIHKE